MDAFVHQILLLFFILPPLTHSKNPCPVSTCGFKNNHLQIQYPFMLQTDNLPKDCRNFINLRCDNEGKVVINLPSLGDFYVTSIDYALRKIALTDPGNCLPGRLMMSNFFPYPLQAYFYKTYTYYTCRKEKGITSPFTEIRCLSNSLNATVVATDLSNEFTRELYGCMLVASSTIPVTSSDEHNISAEYGELQLTWYAPTYSEDSKSKWVKFFQSSAFIASAAVLVTFSGLACLVRAAKLIDATANSTVEGGATTESSAATSTTLAPPGATSVTLSAEKYQVKNFVVLLGENQGTLVSCSICLEEYSGKDRVGNLVQCGHYFHVECIDGWLQKNSSCPVCRTSIS